MSELEFNAVRIITNCHPGEKVGKQFGEELVPEFAQRGYKVEPVSMSDTCEEGGRSVPWYESLAMPEGLKRRMDQEEALISREPRTLNILCHDWGSLLKYGFDAFVERVDGFGRTVLVEVGAALKETSDAERLTVAERLGHCFTSDLIRLESDTNDPATLERLKPQFVSQVADSILRLVGGDIPCEYLSRGK